MSPVTEYISSSPLLANCGFTKEDVVGNEHEWLKVSAMIKQHLQLEEENLTPAQRSRVYQYYLPLAMWIENLLADHKKTGSQSALVIGISAPQGCGKSTIVECLQAVFEGRGVRSVSVSIDDFYLTRAEQVALAEANKGNPLLELRGNAGSHDNQLGTDTLKQLKGLVEKGATASVPRYDKSKHSGKGDRADASEWPAVTGPIDVVLFEGWMLGFKSIGSTRAAAVSPHLPAVDKALTLLEDAWDKFVDVWLVVKVGDPKWVFKWRLEAEHKMRLTGKPGMSDSEVEDFCNRYMPAYKAYLPGLYDHGPTTVKPGKSLMIELDNTRSPVDKQPASLDSVKGAVTDDAKPTSASSKANTMAGAELLLLCVLVFLL
ncbi:hypothetical protein BSKO_08707 [Bryopsis sp. KO-2023]|nr:hypothetical protein BSKO_08707 [Bryopsis sp. KO-2023]